MQELNECPLREFDGYQSYNDQPIAQTVARTGHRLTPALKLMIDLQARSRLAEASRWLVSGRITNYQYDDCVLYDGGLLASSDPAIREIYSKGFWPTYDDLHQHRLAGRFRLSPQSRAAAARCVLFLKSDIPYDWPVLSRSTCFIFTVINLVTFGVAGLACRRWAERDRDIAYWPFTSRAQFKEALQAPLYLSGHGS